MASVLIDEGGTTVSGSSADSLFVLGGGQAIVTGLDQSALADGYVIVEVGKPYTGQFGTAGNPLFVEITSYMVYAASGGDMYYKGKDTTDATPLVRHIGGGHLHLVTDGTITNFDQVSGQTTISGPFIITNGYTAGGSCTLEDDTSTDPTSWTLVPGPGGTGGSLYTQRGATTFTNKAGQLIIDAGTNTIGTLVCDGSPNVSRTMIQECGTITTLTALGHIPDTSRLSKPLTVTNSTVNMSLPGAQALLDNPLITFTNATAKRITDGRIL